jgi:hypothetical protein
MNCRSTDSSKEYKDVVLTSLSTVFGSPTSQHKLSTSFAVTIISPASQPATTTPDLKMSVASTEMGEQNPADMWALCAKEYSLPSGWRTRSTSLVATYKKKDERTGEDIPLKPISRVGCIVLKKYEGGHKILLVKRSDGHEAAAGKSQLDEKRARRL